MYGLLNGLLGQSIGENPLPIRSSDLQLANKFSVYFLLEVKRISYMFENIPPSKSQLIPDFPILSSTNFAEMSKEEILRIVRTVNKTNCPNDPFNIRKMSSGMILEPISTIFPDIVNTSFSIGKFPESEKYAVIKPLLKAGKDTDELSSYMPLYDTSFALRF